MESNEITKEKPMAQAALTAVSGGVQMFREAGFRFDYPTKETRPSSSGFGYDSDMMHLAVNRDDAAAFMFFMEGCGGPDCEVLLSGSVINYAATHGATECVKALCAIGADKGRGQEHWLKVAANPAYGPRALKPSS